MTIKNLTLSLADAWRQVWRFELPFPQNQDQPGEAIWAVRLLPAAGFALGLSLWAAAWLIGILVQHEIAAATVTAIAIPALYIWLTGGRPLAAVYHITGSIAARNESYPHDLWPLAITQAALLLQGTAILVLSLTSQAWWLAIMPMLGAAAYAELMLSRETNEEKTDNYGPVHWYIAGITTIIIAGAAGQLIPGLFVLVLGWLLAPATLRLLEKKECSPRDALLRAVYHTMEILILWVGVLAI